VHIQNETDNNNNKTNICKTADATASVVFNSPSVTVNISSVYPHCAAEIISLINYTKPVGRLIVDMGNSAS